MLTAVRGCGWPGWKLIATWKNEAKLFKFFPSTFPVSAIHDQPASLSLSVHVKAFQKTRIEREWGASLTKCKQVIRRIKIEKFKWMKVVYFLFEKDTVGRNAPLYRTQVMTLNARTEMDLVSWNQCMITERSNCSFCCNPQLVHHNQN